MWKLKRTHTCGELCASDVGKTVILNGWVDVRRDFGKLVFVDLRDRYGRTQILFSPDRDQAVHDAAASLRGETVIAVKGVVRKRDADTINKKIVTGEIEIDATEFEILNEAKTPPQVEIAPLQPLLLGNGHAVADLERRRLRLVQDLELGRDPERGE